MVPSEDGQVNERQVVARDVSVRGTHEPFVSGIGFTAPAGAVTVVGVDPGVGQVALALAIGGRVDLLTGAVSIGGSTDRAQLQLRTRLVDVPDVTAPEDSFSLRAVVGVEHHDRAYPNHKPAQREAADDHADQQREVTEVYL